MNNKNPVVLSFSPHLLFGGHGWIYLSAQVTYGAKALLWLPCHMVFNALTPTIHSLVYSKAWIPNLSHNLLSGDGDKKSQVAHFCWIFLAADGLFCEFFLFKVRQVK